MKIIFLAAVISGWLTSEPKDDPKYPVSAIPAELKEQADIVFREYELVNTISSKDRIVTYTHKVITILNSNGKAYASEDVGYDKLSKVSYFKGTLYDAEGNVVKKLKGSDIADMSAYDGYSLFSDNRYKSADLTYASYPYTVEFEYEVDSRYVYSIEGMILLPREKLSVQHAAYQLIYKPEVTPRYKVVNMDAKPVHTRRPDGMESLSWTFEQVKSIRLETHGPRSQTPKILAAPTKFEYAGYEGDMSTWQSYGKWEASLMVGRDELPESTRQKVLELTKNLKTTEEKTKVLYEYVQGKTRYVSISLGIGGLQPFPASVVDQVGYGDCKALSNYMVSLLKIAGIKAYYTTVKAGDFAFDLIEDFPSHQGNHVIVSVPNGADTLWLECTNQTVPFGYSGRFTGDRRAYMLTEDGGRWTNTHRYTEDQNIQSRTADVTVEATGNAKARVKTTYAGLQYENDGLDFIVDDSFDDQKKWVQKTTQIPAFDVNSFSMRNEKKKIPAAIVKLDLTLNRYATASGKRLFITPNLMNRNSYLPEKVENRKTKVVLNLPYTDLDTIHYHLPEGIYPEFVPQPVVIQSRFGEYEVKYQLDEKGLTYIRRMRMRKGEFPAESYQELIDFYKNINKSDNTKLVFVSKT